MNHEVEELIMRPMNMNDVEAVSHYVDHSLRRDYFFRRSHLRFLVESESCQPWVITTRTVPPSERERLIGFCVTYKYNRLTNLWIDAEYRGQGWGRKVIEALRPTEIRAKHDMTTGDPTPFYKHLGYNECIQEKFRNSTITLLRNTEEFSTPENPGENPRN